jgi:RNA polymerase sigma-70 factor (ECF subfamily)
VTLPPLEQLYVRYGPVVLRRALQLLGNQQEAQDVLQDVFAVLLQQAQQFEGRSSPVTFLYTITTNCALGRLRSRRTRGALLRAHYFEREEPASAGPEMLVQLRHQLALLPEELARVAVYYHLDEMSQDEIALLLGCSRQRVGKLLQRLRETAPEDVEP